VGFDADHVRLDAVSNFTENILQVGGFAPPARSDINDFDLDFFFPNIDNRHAGILAFGVILLSRHTF
jgi:hypothetical protein